MKYVIVLEVILVLIVQYFVVKDNLPIIILVSHNVLQIPLLTLPIDNVKNVQMLKDIFTIMFLQLANNASMVAKLVIILMIFALLVIRQEY